MKKMGQVKLAQMGQFYVAVYNGKVTGVLHKIDYDGLRAARIERVEYVVQAAA